MQNKPHSSSDVIDLFGLFLSLWQRKLTIFAITCIGVALAAGYAFTSKEEWTSKAQFIPAKAVQLGNYLEVQRWYSRFTSDDSINIGDLSEAVQTGYSRFAGDDSKKVDDSLKYAYKTLIVMLNALDNKLEFLQNSDYFKQQVMELDGDVAKQRMLIDMATNDLQVKETEKSNGESFDISFVAETASDARQTLHGYIESTNKLVLKKLFDDLRLQINERILTLENNVANIKLQTEQSRKNQIMVLKQAIVSAKDANITEYTGESTVAGNTIIDFSNSENMFLLGEKYLTAQLASLESSPIIYPISYYQTLTNISGLKQLMKFEPKGTTFEYTRSPSKPLVKDKPRKSLILILGVLIGGMLGCGVVLAQYAINNRKTVS